MSRLAGPLPGDEGRAVVYRVTGERGVVSSWNEHYVFVRYDGDLHAKATRREDLRWEHQR